MEVMYALISKELEEKLTREEDNKIVGFVNI